LEDELQKKQLGFLLMSASAVGLAVGTIMMKILPAEAGLTPGQVAVWRFLIASPLMWLFTLGRIRGKALRPESPAKLLGLGVVYSLASLLALLALNRLPSSIYVIILFFYPAIIVVSHLINRKPIPQLWWLGIPMTLVGLVLTVAPSGQLVRLDPLGILFSILNGITIAVYMLLSERVFGQVRDRQLGSTWMMTGAMGVGLALALIYGFKLPDSVQGWIYLVTLGLVGTLIPILSMNIGIQMIGSARSSVISTLQPVVAVLISTAFLHEVLTVRQWLGGGLVIIAIILLQRSPDAHATQRGPHYDRS
jgi:drug/metabolite transporter (DMT)-like permease